MTVLTGTIQNVRVGPPDSTDYGTLNVYYLDIAGSNGGSIQGGKLRAKTYEPTVGEEIKVEVSDGNPPFLKRLTDFEEKGQPNGGGRQANPQRSARIERQHSQEMAVRALQIQWADGVPSLESGDLAKAITDWTDWFVKDLDNTSVRAGSPPPSSADSAEGASEGAVQGASLSEDVPF